MTRDALVAKARRPFDAVCVRCKAETCAPTEVGSVERASGPPVVLYACPRCVLGTGAGPTPGEDISPPSAPAGATGAPE
ncbi:hypothetical protein ACFYXL_04215 [Streptomyces tsukubensis]|uniref:hypothetical protein n=1 Tax=Streptomyces tsukubensis TaxID=83656 RepID=UPI0036877022